MNKTIQSELPPLPRTPILRYYGSHTPLQELYSAEQVLEWGRRAIIAERERKVDTECIAVNLMRFSGLSKELARLVARLAVLTPQSSTLKSSEHWVDEKKEGYEEYLTNQRAAYNKLTQCVVDAGPPEVCIRSDD